VSRRTGPQRVGRSLRDVCTGCGRYEPHGLRDARDKIFVPTNGRPAEGIYAPRSGRPTRSGPARQDMIFAGIESLAKAGGWNGMYTSGSDSEGEAVGEGLRGMSEDPQRLGAFEDVP
jgi:hypothetical protein